MWNNVKWHTNEDSEVESQETSWNQLVIRKQSFTLLETFDISWLNQKVSQETPHGG